MAEPTPLTAYQQSYHWRNKNCGPWAQEWVRKSLPGLQASGDGNTAEVSDVTSVDGDCDLGQRKGKLLTIYDIEVSAKWKGTNAAGDEFNGTLKIPEFSHEMIDGLSEYVFEFGIEQSGAEADAMRAWVRKALPPVLEAKLNGFRDELLTAHGIFETPAGSGASTPAAFKNTGGYSPAPPGEVRSPKTAPAAGAAKPAEKKADSAPMSTVTVEASAELQASADDLWTLLTDAQRVPLWSRSEAKITPEKGSEYELFGGNVSGKILEADKPKKLVQSWKTKSPGWPENHYGTMTISFQQGSDSTKVTFALDGVPSGKQADIERAIDAFYIRGLKQMGLVVSSSSRTYVRERPAVNSSSSLAAAGATFGAAGGAKAAPAATGTRRKGGKRKAHAQAQAGGVGWIARLTTPQVLGTSAALGAAAVFAALVAGSFKPSVGSS